MRADERTVGRTRRVWHKLRRDELPPHIKLTLGRRESRRRLLPAQIERVNFLRNSSADNLEILSGANATTAAAGVSRTMLGLVRA